jgi:alanine dehydrogenase
MNERLLYLSRENVKSLAIEPREARETLLQAFRDHAAGLNSSLPKSSLMLGPGHGFQAMSAASKADSIATLKWVAMAPVERDSPVPGINGLIVINDYASGAPLAVLDGDEITLVRTAALSAAAASLLAPPQPATIGFIGCGLQAHAHLAAFRDLYPGLTTLLAYSRSRASAEDLSKAAIASGLSTEVVGDAATVLSRSDIVISTVPGAPGLRPFLDARAMKPQAFASAVDIGRSWIPESLPAFDVLVTDSLAQSKAPYDIDGNPVKTVTFGYDLAGLASAPHPTSANSRSFFCFRGFALADLALANLVFKRATERGIGTTLPR